MSGLSRTDERHSTLFTDEDTGESFLWPNCAIPGCKHQSCLAEDSQYCWPHNQMRLRGATLTEMMQQPTPAPPPPTSKG